MASVDKVENKTQDIKGNAKKAVGDVTGNERLQTEGQADQAKNSVKKAARKIGAKAKAAVRK